MYSMLSYLERIRSFLQNWNGFHNSKIRKVNSKVQKYHQKNGYSLKIEKIIKISEEYVNSSYIKLLQNGVLSCNVKITNDSIIFDKNPANSDSYSLIVNLFRKNHNKVVRKVNI